MKRFGKIFLFSLYLLLGFLITVSCRNNNFHITGNIEGFGSGTVYLAFYNRDKIISIDSANVLNGEISMMIPKTMLPCMLRIFDKKNKDVGFELVYNKEDIQFKTKADSLVSAMKIIKSEENILFYTFYPLQSTLREMIQLGDKLNENDPVGNKTKLVELDKLSNELELKINNLFNELDSNAQKLFAYRIIKSMILPNYDIYLAKGGIKYSDAYEFTQKHFFDNIDFTDTLLLRTPVIYHALKDYFQDYVYPKTSEVLKKTSDFLISKASVNDKMYDFVAHFLIKILEPSDFMDVYLYVMETYLSENICNEEGVSGKDQNKYELVKKSIPGNIVEDFSGKTPDGRTVSLNEVKSDAIILFFWAPDCAHCLHAAELLQDTWKKYGGKGMTILAFGITNKENEWTTAITSHSMGAWLNITDLKDRDSKVFSILHIRGTPELYLIDKNKTIVSRPSNMMVLDEEIAKLLKGR